MPITIDDADVQRKLRQLDNLEPVLRPVLFKNQREIQKALKKYPPPPPSSRYVRTFNLRGSRQIAPIEFRKNDARARIYSDGSARTRYGQYERWVMDADKQAHIHQGRWHTTKSVEEDFTDDVTRDVKAALDKAVKS